jgi:hypothetical protein
VRGISLSAGRGRLFLCFKFSILKKHDWRAPSFTKMLPLWPRRWIALLNSSNFYVMAIFLECYKHCTPPSIHIWTSASESPCRIAEPSVVRLKGVQKPFLGMSSSSKPILALQLNRSFEAKIIRQMKKSNHIPYLSYSGEYNRQTNKIRVRTSL